MRIINERFPRISSLGAIAAEVKGGAGTWAIHARVTNPDGTGYNILTPGLAEPPSPHKLNVWRESIALAVNTGRNVGAWWRDSDGTVLAPCGAF